VGAGGLATGCGGSHSTPAVTVVGRSTSTDDVAGFCMKHFELSHPNEAKDVAK
jgi:hypothetical protein